MICLLLLGLGFQAANASVNAANVLGSDAKNANTIDVPSACKISISKNYGDDPSTCSGALISDHEILSAAHCFKQDFDFNSSSIAVSCGDQATDRVLKVILPDHKFWRGNDRTLVAYDLAQIVIEPFGDSGPTPIDYSRSAEEFFGPIEYNLTVQRHLKPGVKCAFAGFGEDESGVVGNLRTWDLSNVNLRLDSNQLILSSAKGDLTTSLSHGDSGGPLLCTLGGITKVIGIAGGYLLNDKTRGDEYNFLAAPWVGLSPDAANMSTIGLETSYDKILSNF